MSRTVAFGRDILNAPDVDIEDLLACLSSTEVQQMLDELASDPDDKHVPPSVRNAYRCNKVATGPLNHTSLVSYIKQEGLASPDIEEEVPFQPGVKRGKVFIPILTEEEEAERLKKAEIAEKVKLEPDEEQALAEATVTEVMALADILNTNPQNFIMEAYADDLQYFEPDQPNVTNPTEVLEKLSADDACLTNVNLNNVANIEEKQMCDIFDSLRKNNNLTQLSVVNCDINDFAVATLILALEGNKSLTSLNLEGNKISPDTLAKLFESLASCPNNINELKVAGQQQEKMGYRVESKIADAVCDNPRLIKLGMKFEFKDVLNRVSRHLIRNMDTLRKQRREGLLPDSEKQPVLNVLKSEETHANAEVEKIDHNVSETVEESN